MHVCINSSRAVLVGDVQQHKRITTIEINLQIRTAKDTRFEKFRRAGRATEDKQGVMVLQCESPKGFVLI